MEIYRVKSNGIESDKTKKRWEKGAKVTSKDFPKSVILDWIKLGVLEQTEDGEE